MNLKTTDSLVFMHVEKTAGSTVFNVLSSMFDPKDICPERFEQIGLLSSISLEQYRFFCAHASINDFKEVPKPAKYITFLRDPVERSVSLYKFWNSINYEYAIRNRLYGPLLAQTLSVHEFFSIENNWKTHATNRYTELLIGDPIPRSGTHILEDAEERADRAIKQLECFAFIGISEIIDLSLDKMSLYFDIPKIFNYENINITRNNHLIDSDRFIEEKEIDIPDDVADLISINNASDQIIYDFVLENIYGFKNLSRTLDLISHSNASVRNGRNAQWVSNADGGVLLYGPYIRLRRGVYEIELEEKSKDYLEKLSSNIKIEVACNLGNSIIKSKNKIKQISKSHYIVSAEFEINSISSDFEFRVYCQQNYNGEVSRKANLNRISFR